jgi:hypothetical protein
VQAGCTLAGQPRDEALESNLFLGFIIGFVLTINPKLESLIASEAISRFATGIILHTNSLNLPAFK